MYVMHIMCDTLAGYLGLCLYILNFKYTIWVWEPPITTTYNGEHIIICS